MEEDENIAETRDLRSIEGQHSHRENHCCNELDPFTM